ncbi:type II toxin-antitoxin system RelE/ParE family toxin [Shewanella algae]|uniref:type II toxin-antitoxin system RelE/ParE family toxin n=1 Tax=Shewanella algae TaxID=38313 RepID=UPI00313B39F4
MDHIVCINENSFPAPDKLTANDLFLDAIHGALELYEIGDRYAFYLDVSSGSLLDFEIFPDYSIDDFLSEVDDADISTFIYEVEDKSPAIDHLTEGQLDEVTEFTYYMADFAADKKPEVFAIACVLGAYLLSIKSENRWCDSKIEVSRLDANSQFVEGTIDIKNLSCYEHGAFYSELLSKLDVRSVLDDHLCTDEFVGWFDSLNSLNKWSVYQKMKLACSRSFGGGRPLIDTLDDADGLKEIRIKTPQNAIRVLFKNHRDDKQAILIGFTKKANNEGYDDAIKKANELYKALG